MSTADGSDPYVPGHGDASYSVRHYDLDLDYKPAGNRLSGEATLTCEPLAEELTRITLDLHHLTASKVWVEGTAVRFTHRRGRLSVRLAKPLRAGRWFEVRVKYAGSPRPVRKRHLGDAGWEELTDGVIVAAQPHGAPSWFPCNDRPDDKATYKIRLELPADYHVALNGGSGRGTRRGATRTWTGRMTVPMATYLATLQIGRYDARTLPSAGSTTEVRLVAPAGVEGPVLEATFGRQPEMVVAFEERFGPYPFPEAGYASVITDDDLEIPLESQSLSTFGRNFTTGAVGETGEDQWDHERLVAHELAHQWFGNAVTLGTWRDIWLHEGFACYAEWLWSEASGRATAVEWADTFHARLSDLPQDLLLGDPGPDLMFDDRVYKRGALTLAALRARVGDDLFFNLLRRWVADHAGGTVSTALFEAHCAALVGEPLADLFDVWLRETGLPARSW